ncbi:MAG: bifunctional diaminohydroxyphosphoribosylaminopyrimidine deaminase/5-amino-6-(5-phosphoribosylamino)uracil reductase RibD [Phycisphaerae bacterium]|nr:bifunctional diaminohydroxyphosphoribosylaminopyrimidine deaminase/5-amino-6-(5-phosphoribosylamino)uracil reductase RibD [Phycisphaerae bacterium]
MINKDEKYMRMALELAQRGVGSVEPNPSVGCVIVKDNKIIGKGWHEKFGGPHAEINSLKNCKRTPRGATMYVTLEPCCHFGKTGPCTDAIIKSGIKKVVAATKDPTKKVNGKGLKILKEAGIEVKMDVCKKEAQLLNAPFFKFARTKRPWIIIKWAQSRDGFLARTDKKRWITGAKSRKDAHKLRRRAQAVLVGINTVLSDDPKLTARPGTGRQPLRIVLDSQLKIPLDCNLVKTVKKTPVAVFTTQKNNKKSPILKKKGVEVVTVASTGGKCRLRDVLSRLGERGVQQILVEGGPTVIMSFLRQGLVDEVCVYVAPKMLGSQGSAEATGRMAELSEAVGLHSVDIKRFGDDVRIAGFSKNM